MAAQICSKDKKNPELLRQLLLATDSVPDHAGRDHYKRTAYQLALGAREYNVTSDNGTQVVDGLIEMLGDYFKKLSDGERLREDQYNKQFTKESEAAEKQKIADDSRELNQILKVIAEASDEGCQQTMALDSFHGMDLRPLSCAEKEDEILAGAIYLEDKTESKDGITYQVRGFDGQVKHGMITWDQLPTDCPHSVNDIIKQKKQYLPAIIEQVAKAGYTYTTSQMNELQQLSQTIVKATTDEAFETAYQKLQATIATLLPTSANFDVLKALYRFRNYLEPQGHYTTGHHFNQQLLLEAYQQYNAQYQGSDDDWSKPKNVLRWQKVVGLIQRLLPACDAQVIAQGLYYVIEDNKKSKRSFSFTHSNGSIFPLDSDPIFRLGYNWAVGLGGAGDVVGRWAYAVGKLISSKNSSAAKIMPRSDNQSPSKCVVM